jgi:hypothetical protein
MLLYCILLELLLFYFYAGPLKVHLKCSLVRVKHGLCVYMYMRSCCCLTIVCGGCRVVLWRV